MKYIRTKDGIFTDKLYKQALEICALTYENAQKTDLKVIKEADNIKELCDEFVYIDDYERPYLCNFDYNQDAIIHYKNGEIGYIFKASKII